MQDLGGVSTMGARYLDILHPPARKLNLIETGHIVQLVWVYEPSDCGKIHRVGNTSTPAKRLIRCLMTSMVRCQHDRHNVAG